MALPYILIVSIHSYLKESPIKCIAICFYAQYPLQHIANHTVILLLVRSHVIVDGGSRLSDFVRLHRRIFQLKVLAPHQEVHPQRSVRYYIAILPDAQFCRHQRVRSHPAAYPVHPLVFRVPIADNAPRPFGQHHDVSISRLSQ